MKLNLKTATALCFLIGFCVKVKGQSYLNVSSTDTIVKLCESIANDSVVESDRIYSMAMPSTQWKRFLILLEFCDDTMLYELTSHKSPAIRLYSYWGLVERNNKGLLMKAVRENENDTAMVSQQSGCIYSRGRVITKAVYAVYFKYISKHKICKLNKADCEYIERLYRAEQYRYRELIKKKESESVH